MMLPDKDKTE